MQTVTTNSTSPKLEGQSLEAAAEVSVDALIIGAGGGGLALLWGMAESGYLSKRKVVVIEPREKTENDRTWCFWAQPEDSIVRELEPCISHRWDRARTSGCVDPLKPYRYYQVRSADFYKMVKARLKEFPEFQWIKGEVSSALSADAQQVEVGAAVFRAKKVFDSRVGAELERRKSSAEVDLWQSFVGWRIQSSRPVFDCRQMEMMNFEVPQDGGTQFLYLLPTGEREALVELTRFGKDLIDEESAEQFLQAYCLALKAEFTILEREQGQIPMSMALNPQEEFHSLDQQVIPIGTSGGAVKSTTGYAFYQMLDHGRKISEALLQESAVPTLYRKDRFEFYDGLLLHILKKWPGRGRPIFERLFQRVSTPKVLSFLSEETRLREEVPILGSLPFLPFLRALDERHVNGAVSSFISLLSGRNFQRNIAVWLAAALLLLYQFAPAAVEVAAWPLLILGLIFPGIPHGAVDHVLEGKGGVSGPALVRFIGSYLGIMALVVGLWWLSPLVGLSLFLLYSAWHFGETDLKHWKSYTAPSAGIYGLSLLGFLLATHPQEMVEYLSALGITEVQSLTAIFWISVRVISVFGILWTGRRVHPERMGSYMATVMLLLLSVFLPLILAFALYFIGLHSFRAWGHLKSGLSLSTPELFRLALPFSVGAYALLAALAAAIYFLDLPFTGLSSAVFIFLAAVSAPHIWMMHGFYGGQKAAE